MLSAKAIFLYIILMLNIVHIMLPPNNFIYYNREGIIIIIIFKYYEIIYNYVIKINIYFNIGKMYLYLL